MAQLQRLERDLAGVLSLPDLAGHVDDVRRLVGASGSTIFSFDHAGGVAAHGGTLEQPLGDYPEDLFAGDPLIRHARAMPPSSYLVAHNFDAGAYLVSRAYREFYQPRDIGFLCAVWPTGLPFGAPDMFGLMLVTPTVSQRFGEEDLGKLKQLESPLRSAARRMARFRALEQKGLVLQQLLERQSKAFVLWDPEGRLVCVSSQAQRELEGSLGRSELEHAARLALRQLRRTDEATRETVLGRPHRIRSARGTPLLAELSWIAGPDRRPWLLAELATCEGTRALMARLTASEARVLRSLGLGLTNREICEQLSISRETVKTHLRRIFVKLGVNSRWKAALLAREGRELS